MKRKLVAVLACRNGGSRLYGKPLQNLDVKKKVNILNYLIKNIKKLKDVNEIVLAISNRSENKEYKSIAKKNSIKFIFGDDEDVLFRLIKASKKTGATDVLRITTESPFPHLESFSKIWLKHVKRNYDATFLDEIIDGCGFEIIKTKALLKSHLKGKKKHKSELCSLFIRENNQLFNIHRIIPNKKYFRKDLRFTVDNPEDLIVCREVFKYFEKKTISLSKMINFMDKKPELKKIIKPYCESGYKNMYNWSQKK